MKAFALRAALVALASAFVVGGCSGGGSSSPSVPSPTATATATPRPPGASPTPFPALTLTAEYDLPSHGAPKVHPIVALDGSIWYADAAAPTLYRIDSRGVVSVHPTASTAGAGAEVRSLAAGPDGDIYYALDSGGPAAFEIRTVAPDGTDALYAQPANTCIDGLVFDRDVLQGIGTVAQAPAAGGTPVCHGAALASQQSALYRFSARGALDRTTVLPGTGIRAGQPVLGADGRIWFFEFDAVSGSLATLAAATSAGSVRPYPLKVSPFADRLVRGPYRSLYFAAAGGPMVDKIDITGAERTLPLQRGGTVYDVTLGLDNGIWFVGFENAGAYGTFGRRKAGVPLTVYAFPRIPDAIVTGTDGYYYVFEHASGSSHEAVAKVNLP